ncbi:MAG: four helix bundle protein [Candidatus Cloacimonetes bacterium]|nr:four helix bundle protein [Candidatus Cloacimonadota bacterium]
MHQYGFEKLSGWQNSRKLIKQVCFLTKGLPSEDKFGLVSQIQRAAVSVSSNIAEGSSRCNRKDQSHFYHTAYASLMEVLCQLILCHDLENVSNDAYNITRELIDVVSYQLNQLRNATPSSPSQPSQPSQPSRPPQPAKQRK